MAPTRRRFLMTIAEVYPTHRADVRVLFGKYLPRYGVETDIVGVTEEASPPAWPAGRTFLRRVSGRLQTILGDIRQEFTLLRRARQGYDGVIVRDKPVLGLVGWLAARLAGIPFVYWMSFPMPELWLDVARRPGVGLARRIYAWTRGQLGHRILHGVLMHRCDHLFVQSAVMHRELRDKGLRHDRVTEVPMGADLEFEAPADVAAPPTELAGRRVAVYLGTLERSRRPDILVDSAVLVARSIPDYLLVVIGEAEEPMDRGWARRYAAERDAESHCLFLGRLPYDRAQAIARHAEIGLSPFPRTALLESASPTKAVEYMGLGLPVIGNDQPDQAEAIRGSGAGLVVDLSPEGFAKGIVDLLSDPAERARMCAAGRPWVERNRSYRMLADLVGARLQGLPQPADRPQGARRASVGAERDPT